MKAIQLLSVVVVLAGFTQTGEAGLFDRILCRKDAKCCDCAPTCQPQCCQPVIVRPCKTTVHCYQRRCSTLKPPCCDDCCAPKVGCMPCDTDGACCDGDGCGDGNRYDDVCCPTDCGKGAGCCDTKCCKTKCCDPRCCDTCCPDQCDGCCPDTCCVNTCELAQLIYESQTGCYARHRRRAVHKLSDRYDCVCHPEVMCALIYALNDADERVRAKAADEIGDQLRKNPCCCTQKVVSALQCALADCDWRVRWQAKGALKRCGYRVVKCCGQTGCCDTDCCESACCPSCGAPAAATPTDAMPGDLPPDEQAVPGDLPPAESNGSRAPEPPSAYFPRVTPRQSSVRQTSAMESLAALFGLD